VFSKWRIASIAPDNALILPQRANPAGWNCWEPHEAVGAFDEDEIGWHIVNPSKCMAIVSL
jgi:hypothetical protein